MINGILSLLNIKMKLDTGKYKIDDMLYKNLNFDDNSSIIHSFLYITNDFDYRNSKKKENIVKKYRKDIAKIVKKTLQSKQKLQIDPNLYSDLINFDHNLSNDFIFVIENILKTYKVILFDGDDFNLNNLHPLNNYIIFKNDNFEIFSPIYKKNKYSFNNLDNDIQHIININNESSNSDDDVNNALINLTNDEDDEIQYIVPEEYVQFEDLDMELIYLKKSDNQYKRYTKEQQINELTNLTKTIDTDSLIFHDLIENLKESKDVLYQQNLINVAPLEKNFDDGTEYIEDFIDFKNNYPIQPYLKLVYYQNNENLININDGDVIRDSFTDKISKLKPIPTEMTIQLCQDEFTINELKDIAKKYDLKVSGKKEKICEKIVNKLKNELLEFLEKTNNPFLDCIINEEFLFYPDDSKPNIPHEYELYRTLNIDKIKINGFAHIYDDSVEFKTFDVKKYIDMLHNLNINDNVTVYFNNYVHIKSIKGIVTNVINDSLITIKLSDNIQLIRDNITTTDTIYYNLKTINNNYFFVYNEDYIDFKYHKNILNRNIFFLTNDLNIDYVKKIVLPSFQEYIFKNNLSFDSLKNINIFLNDIFNTSVNQLSLNDFNTLKSNIEINPRKQIKRKIPSYPKYVPKNNKYLKFNVDTNNDSLLFRMNHINSFNDKGFTFISKLYDQFNKSNKIKSKSYQDVPDFEFINNFDSFDELIKYKKNLKKYLQIIAHNTLVDNINTLNDTIDNFESNSKKFKKFYNCVKNHYNTLNKYIVNERTYEIKTKNTYEGFENSEKTLVSQDQLAHVQQFDESVFDFSNKTDLDDIIELIGIEISEIELEWITKKSFFIYENQYDDRIKTIEILKDKIKEAKDNNKNKAAKKYEEKLEKLNLKNDNDKELFKSFAYITTYASLLILVIQYKYSNNTIKKLFSKCQQYFSINGYPLNESKDNKSKDNKSLLDYICCIIFIYGHSHQNKYFESVDSIKLRVRTIISSLLSVEKKLDDKLKSISKDIKTTKPPKTKNVQFKPLKDSHIHDKINDSLNDFIIDYKFKLTNIKDHDKKIISYNNLFQIQNIKSSNEQFSLDIENFNDIYIIDDILNNDINYENINLTDDQIDKMTSDLFEIMIEGFKLNDNYNDKTFTDFEELFISNDNHILEINVNKELCDLFYLNEYEFFGDKKNILHNNIVKNKQNIENIKNITLYNVYLLLKSIFKLFHDLFIEQEYDEKNLFITLNSIDNHNIKILINTIQTGFTRLVDIHKTRYFNIDDLKITAELLREEDNKLKLNKKNQLIEQDMYVVSIIENLTGIQLNPNVENNEQEFDENYQLNTDDSDEIENDS